MPLRADIAESSMVRLVLDCDAHRSFRRQQLLSGRPTSTNHTRDALTLLVHPGCPGSDECRGGERSPR
jgi:hypothetical protein